MASDGSQPKLGDLIEVFRIGYSHWAIYVGSGYVVHLASPSEESGAGKSSSSSSSSSSCSSSSKSILADRAIVKKELLSKVAGGDQWRVNNKYDNMDKPLPQRVIVQRAESLVGKEIPYSATSRNCEHFVTMLRSGVSRSDQVIETIAKVGIAAFIAMLLPGSIAEEE